jgi:hypothetical protein
MIARIFDVSGLVILGILALAGFLVPVIVGAVKGDSRVWRGIEAAILAVIGGIIARGFISLLLGSANDSAGAGLVVGWGFFLVPGIVDTTSGQRLLTTPDILLTFASIVGGGTGMMAGIYRIYDWEGLGWLGFPLDVTWALAGNTVGALLHLINIGWGEHGDETRENAHRYAQGFRLKKDFAFTQGNVMSDLHYGPTDNLYRHERTHVWQNRAFGPLFTLTYISWMLVWLIPAMIAGVIVKGASGLGKGPERWCYFNNPWETWAYGVQGADRATVGNPDDGDKRLTWPIKYVIAWAIPFFLVATALSIFAVVSVWLQATKPVSPPHTAPHKSVQPTPHTAPHKSTQPAPHQH